MDGMIPDPKTLEFLEERWRECTMFGQEQILAALDDFLLDIRGEPDECDEDFDLDDDDDDDDEEEESPTCEPDAGGGIDSTKNSNGTSNGSGSSPPG
jgi:hypothetical protein